MAAGSKILWTPKMIAFIHANYSKLSNQKIATAIGVKLTAARMKLYELGYKRMELEYWTKRQIDFLMKNYQAFGDKELAEIFNDRYPKNKRWTLKHIEKKRNYLNLHRTKEELLLIKQKAKNAGVYHTANKKRWLALAAKEGEVRYWRTRERLVPFIKVNGRFVHWARWNYIQTYGPIPEGMNVVFADHDPYNLSVSNLILVTDAELSKRNSKISSQGLSDNYIASIMTWKDPELRKEVKRLPDLIDTKRQQLLLDRKIKKLSK